MSSWWQQLKNRILAQQTSEKSAIAIIQKPLQRDPATQAAYQLWKNSSQQSQLIDWLRAELQNVRSGNADASDAIDFLEMPSAHGFVVHFKELNFPCEQVLFMMDYFKEKIAALPPYYNYLSDERISTCSRGTKSIQRHYLKPMPKHDENGLVQQQYGNILLETCLLNCCVVNFKMSAMHYAGRNYEKQLSFCELLNKVIGFTA